MYKWLHKCRFVICKKGKEKDKGYFNQIQVYDNDDSEVEIDFDCTQGEYNESFCSLPNEGRRSGIVSL